VFIEALAVQLGFALFAFSKLAVTQVL